MPLYDGMVNRLCTEVMNSLDTYCVRVELGRIAIDNSSATLLSHMVHSALLHYKSAYSFRAVNENLNANPLEPRNDDPLFSSVHKNCNKSDKTVLCQTHN